MNCAQLAKKFSAPSHWGGRCKQREIDRKNECKVKRTHSGKCNKASCDYGQNEA